MKALTTMLLLAVFAQGCSYLPSADRFDMPIAGDRYIYTDSKVIRGDIQVMVHPNRNLESPPTALFVPLGITQEMRESNVLSQSISRVVWQSMLEEQTFPVLELANMGPPYRVQMALPIARQMGAQMLVGGYVTYFIDGGTVGDTRVSLQLEVYDVASGDLLWSMAHAGSLPYETKRDYLLFEVKQRMPFDPVGTVVGTLALEMAELLHYWTSPQSFKAPPRSASGTAFGKP